MKFQFAFSFVLLSQVIISIIAYDLQISYVDEKKQKMCYDYDGKFYPPALSLVTGNWTGYLQTNSNDKSAYIRIKQIDESSVPPLKRDGSFADATFHAPQKMATNSDGIVYLIDQINIDNWNYPRIRRIQLGVNEKVNTLCKRSDSDRFAFSVEIGPSSQCDVPFSSFVRAIAVQNNDIYLLAENVVKLTYIGGNNYTAEIYINTSKHLFSYGLEINGQNIYVSDSNGNKVHKYVDKTLTASYNVNAPKDIAYGKDYLYVISENKIVSISTDGTMTTFTTNEFKELNGITFVYKDQGSYLLLTDTGAPAVYQIMVSAFGESFDLTKAVNTLVSNVDSENKMNIAVNTLNHPTDAFIDGRDNIYVIDSNNAAIKRIYPEKNGDCPIFDHDTSKRIKTKALRPRCLQGGLNENINIQLCRTGETSQVFQFIPNVLSGNSHLFKVKEGSNPPSLLRL